MLHICTFSFLLQPQWQSINVTFLFLRIHHLNKKNVPIFFSISTPHTSRKGCLLHLHSAWMSPVKRQHSGREMMQMVERIRPGDSRCARKERDRPPFRKCLYWCLNDSCVSQNSNVFMLFYESTLSNRALIIWRTLWEMLGRAALNSFHQLVGSLVKAQFMARESSKKAGDNFPALHTQAWENPRTKMI